MAQRKSRTYEENKANAEKYFAKCDRIQMLLNPDNSEDKFIIDYLSEHASEGISRQKQIKQMIIKYIKMSEALKGD